MTSISWQLVGPMTSYLYFDRLSCFIDRKHGGERSLLTGKMGSKLPGRIGDVWRKYVSLLYKNLSIATNSNLIEVLVLFYLCCGLLISSPSPSHPSLKKGT